MILLSFTAQARTALACAMMPAAAIEHCCCPSGDGNADRDHDGDHCPQPASADPCCEIVTSSDALLSHAGATTIAGEHQLHSSGVDAPTLAAVESRPWPAIFDTRDRRPLHFTRRTNSLGARPQYLLTARLRL